jgi:hypothetical protein
MLPVHTLCERLLCTRARIAVPCPHPRPTPSSLGNSTDSGDFRGDYERPSTRAERHIYPHTCMIACQYAVQRLWSCIVCCCAGKHPRGCSGSTGFPRALWKASPLTLHTPCTCTQFPGALTANDSRALSKSPIAMSSTAAMGSLHKLAERCKRFWRKSVNISLALAAPAP